MRKPGPAFNYMMAAAYEDGADFMYRVNDDTKFVGPWAETAVRVLGAFDPPNVRTESLQSRPTRSTAHRAASAA